MAQLNSARSEDYAELNCDRVAQYHNVDARKNDIECHVSVVPSSVPVLCAARKKKKKLRGSVRDSTSLGKPTSSDDAHPTLRGPQFKKL